MCGQRWRIRASCYAVAIGLVLWTSSRVTHPAAQVAQENVERDGEQLMTKQEIEALGQAMLKEHGLPEWTVRAVYGAR
jgi:hypothetical protein